jgi:class 3 adenylate cyclase
MPGRVAVSGAALERATPAEVARWTVIGTRRLRGREADTELAVPSDGAATAGEGDTVDGSERARSGVTRG